MAGFGETLRQARAVKGVTLREAEQATRINRHHLAALEDETFDALPPLIYQRGIVRNYASYLDLDPGKLITMFEEAHGITATGASASVAAPPIDMPSHWAPNFAIIGFAVVLSAIIFAWGYSIWVTPGADDADDPALALVNTPVTEATQITADLPDAPAPPTVPATESPAPTATNEEATKISGRATESPSEPVYVTGLAVEASADLTLKIIVDGEVVFDDVLPAGAETEQFVGSLFDISTSAAEDTIFINSCGDRGPLQNMQGSQRFEFPAHEGSCKP